jgi:hypothetical protein
MGRACRRMEKLLGRDRRRLQDNIKVDEKEYGLRVWTR